MGRPCCSNSCITPLIYEEKGGVKYYSKYGPENIPFSVDNATDDFLEELSKNAKIGIKWNATYNSIQWRERDFPAGAAAYEAALAIVSALFTNFYSDVPPGVGGLDGFKNGSYLPQFSDATQYTTYRAYIPNSDVKDILKTTDNFYKSFLENSTYSLSAPNTWCPSDTNFSCIIEEYLQNVENYVDGVYPKTPWLPFPPIPFDRGDGLGGNMQAVLDGRITNITVLDDPRFYNHQTESVTVGELHTEGGAIVIGANPPQLSGMITGKYYAVPNFNSPPLKIKIGDTITVIRNLDGDSRDYTVVSRTPAGYYELSGDISDGLSTGSSLFCAKKVDITYTVSKRYFFSSRIGSFGMSFNQALAVKQYSGEISPDENVYTLTLKSLSLNGSRIYTNNVFYIGNTVVSKDACLSFYQMPTQAFDDMLTLTVTNLKIPEDYNLRNNIHLKDVDYIIQEKKNYIIRDYDSTKTIPLFCGTFIDNNIRNTIGKVPSKMFLDTENNTCLYNRGFDGVLILDAGNTFKTNCYYFLVRFFLLNPTSSYTANFRINNSLYYPCELPAWVVSGIFQYKHIDSRCTNRIITLSLFVNTRSGCYSVDNSVYITENNFLPPVSYPPQGVNLDSESFTFTTNGCQPLTFERI